MATIQSKQVVVNQSPLQKCWRLVHANGRVIAIFQATGLTETPHNLFCADFKEECIVEIARLNLEVPEGMMESIYEEQG